jgi:hypothetical protein
VVERIDDMPAGVLGFRSQDELTSDDFATVIVPALEAAVAAGEVRLLLITPPNFGTADVKPLADRVKDLTGLGHRTDWKRIAVLTDSATLRRSSAVWTRMLPVETKVFKPAEEPTARAWLAKA